jgi:hypothetical protein
MFWTVFLATDYNDTYGEVPRVTLRHGADQRI